MKKEVYIYLLNKQKQRTNEHTSNNQKRISKKNGFS
jgi:hypothetical protein